MEEKALVKVSKAAKALGLSIGNAREKIRSGEWPTYKFGTRSTRVDLSEIKRIARRAAQKSTGESAA